MYAEVMLLDYTFLYISILILTFWNAYQSCHLSLVCMQLSVFSLTSKPGGINFTKNTYGLHFMGFAIRMDFLINIIEIRFK